MSDIHSSTKFVLKNGVNALEFKSRKSMLAYRKRFCQLFPDVDASSLNMFKVVVYQIKS